MLLEGCLCFYGREGCFLQQVCFKRMLLEGRSCKHRRQEEEQEERRQDVWSLWQQLIELTLASAKRERGCRDAAPFFVAFGQGSDG